MSGARSFAAAQDDSAANRATNQAQATHHLRSFIGRSEPHDEGRIPSKSRGLNNQFGGAHYAISDIGRSDSRNEATIPSKCRSLIIDSAAHTTPNRYSAFPGESMNQQSKMEKRKSQIANRKSKMARSPARAA
jgi:hypothetical protein